MAFTETWFAPTEAYLKAFFVQCQTMSSPSFSAMSEIDFNILQGALVVMPMCP